MGPRKTIRPERRWGVNHLIAREELGLRPDDVVELVNSYEKHALFFRIMLRGEKTDLLYALDRLIWHLQEMRHKISKQEDE